MTVDFIVSKMTTDSIASGMTTDSIAYVIAAPKGSQKT